MLHISKTMAMDNVAITVAGIVVVVYGLAVLYTCYEDNKQAQQRAARKAKHS